MDVKPMTLRILFTGGILVPIILAVTDVVGGFQTPGYNFASESASALASPGAPTRPLVLTLQLVSAIAIVAFASGLWQASPQDRVRRAIAGSLVAIEGLSLVALLAFPWHSAEPADSPANVLNLALMAPSIVLWFLTIGTGLAMRNPLRYFSLALLLAFLVLTVLAVGVGPLIAGQPGPRVGLQERSMIYGCWLWLGALATLQLRSLQDRGISTRHNVFLRKHGTWFRSTARTRGVR